MVRALGPRTTGRGYRLVDVAEGKTVLPVTTSGAYTLDVAGRNGAAITIDGDFGPLDFTGWDAADGNGDFSRQTIRVDIIQDATGGHVFDWNQTEGVWAELLGDLSTAPGDVTVRFDVVTIDGGANVSLEPVGVTYTMGCLYSQTVNEAMPANAANDTVTVNHGFSVVGSVELIDRATGQAARASWAQTDGANPSSPIRVTLVSAHAAGELDVRVTGQSATPCQLSVSTDEWVTIPMAVTAGETNLSPRLVWSGAADGVQWNWGDGSAAETPVSTTPLSHAYAPPFGGTVNLRYRKGVTLTDFESNNDDFAFDLAVLEAETALTRLELNLSDVVGNLSSLSGMTGMVDLSLFLASGIQGNVGSLANMTGMTNLRLDFTPVLGDVIFAASMPGLVQLTMQNTNLDGDIVHLGALTAPNQVTLTNTDVGGDIAVFAPKTSLSILALDSTNVDGDIANLAALTGLTILQLSTTGVNGDITAFGGMTSLTQLLFASTLVDGDIADLATLTSLTRLEGNNSLIDGDIASLATLTAMTDLELDNTALTGDPSVAVAAMPNLKTFAYSNVGTPPTGPQLDAVIATLAAGTVTAGTLAIAGTNPTITNTAGVATLQGRGWTVTHN